MRLTVLTVSVVPAGMVAAFKDAAARQAQHVAINAMNLFRIILALRSWIFNCAQKRDNGQRLIYYGVL
jgi:hypothetical protein